MIFLREGLITTGDTRCCDTRCRPYPRVQLHAVKGFWKTVGPSCHCIGVLSDTLSSVSQTAVFHNPQRRALRARSGHAVANSRLAHRVLKETSLTAYRATVTESAPRQWLRYGNHQPKSTARPKTVAQWHKRKSTLLPSRSLLRNRGFMSTQATDQKSSSSTSCVREMGGGNSSTCLIVRRVSTGSIPVKG